MNAKTLSNSPKFPINTNPRDVFSNLTKYEHAVLEFFLAKKVHVPVLTYSQETITEELKASGLKISERSVWQAMKGLVMKGLISTKQRWNNSLVTTLSVLFSRPDWHTEMWHWFRQYPNPFASVKQLTSSVSSRVGGLANYLTRSVKTLLHSLLSGKEKVSMASSEVAREVNHDLVRGICIALNKRGACMTNEQCLNLLAFPRDVLEKVCQEMKTATGLDSPAAFFYSQCRKYTVESGRKPDWSKVQLLGEKGYAVMSESEERKNFNGHEEREEKTPKREQMKIRHTKSAREQMRLEAEKAEKRKAPVVPVEEEIAGLRKSIAELAVSENKFAQFGLISLRRRLFELTGEGENPDKESHISNPEHDMIIRNVMAAGGWKKIQPVADLKVSVKKDTAPYNTGESVHEDDLSYPGEPSTNTQTSFIRG